MKTCPRCKGYLEQYDCEWSGQFEDYSIVITSITERCLDCGLMLTTKGDI